MLNRANFDIDELAPAAKPPAEESDSFWENREGIPWERDLLVLFVRNQIRVGWAMPVLAALFTIVNVMWLPFTHVATWLAAAAGCQAIQFFLCKQYLQNQGEGHSHGEWIGMLAASELLVASCWSAPLYSFWDNVGELQHFYLIFTIMAAIGVRIMIAANFMPIVIAGTGFMACSVAVRCILQDDPVYAAVGAVTLALEIFFIQVAVRLQETARDMLIFRAQKERLITRLKTEKRVADQRAPARRGCEPGQVAVPRDHEPRAAHAAQRHSGLFGNPQPRDVRAAWRSDLQDLCRRHPQFRPLPAHAHQRHSRSVAHRSWPARSSGRTCFTAQSIQKAVHVVEMRLRQKHQTLDIEVAPDLPKVMADERALQQIWLNLLSNATKFTPQDGQISITAQRAESGRLLLASPIRDPASPRAILQWLPARSAAAPTP